MHARPAVIKVNEIVFVHGGIDESAAAIGCEEINATIQRELARPPSLPGELPGRLSLSESGPLLRA